MCVRVVTAHVCVIRLNPIALLIITIRSVGVKGCVIFCQCLYVGVEIPTKPAAKLSFKQIRGVSRFVMNMKSSRSVSFSLKCLHLFRIGSPAISQAVCGLSVKVFY